METKTKIPFASAIRACNSFEEFYARFSGAPNWVLDRIEGALACRGYDGGFDDRTMEVVGSGWATNGPCYLPEMVPALRRRVAAEGSAQVWFQENPEYVGLVSVETMVRAFERGTVQFGDGPTMSNWCYSDDNPGEYSDEAFTSTEEVSPGVHFESRHACLGSTRRWAVIESPEAIRAKK